MLFDARIKTQAMKYNKTKNFSMKTFFGNPCLGIKFILIDFYPIYLTKRREFSNHENGMILRKKENGFYGSNLLWLGRFSLGLKRS